MADEVKEYPTHEHPDDPVIHSTPKFKPSEETPSEPIQVTKPMEVKLALMKCAANLLGKFNYIYFTNLIKVIKPEQFNGDLGRMAFPRLAEKSDSFHFSEIKPEDVQDYVTRSILSSLDQYFKFAANSYTNLCNPCLSIHIEPNKIEVHITLYDIDAQIED